MIEKIFLRIRSSCIRLNYFWLGIRISFNAHILVGKRSKASFGKGSRIMFNCYIRLLENAKFSTGSKLYVSQGTEIFLTEGASLLIGDNLFIGSNCNIRCSGSINIGSNVRIAQLVSIIDANYNLENGKIGNIVPENLTIEDDVWIGAGSILLPGIVVGKGSVIGAGSVVTKTVKSNSIFAGNPAKFVRNL